MSKNLIQTKTKLTIKNSTTKNICKTCSTPEKFKTKNILKELVRRLHGGTRDVIKSGKSSRYLSTIKVQTEGSKIVDFNLYEGMFTCQKKLESRKTQGTETCIKCII